MFISFRHASVRAHSPPPIIIIACIGRTFYSFWYADLQKYLFCSVHAMAFIINGCDCERWFVFGCRAVPFFVFGFSVSQIVFILLYVDRQLQRGTFWSSHGPICNLLQLKWAHLLKCWHFFVHRVRENVPMEFYNCRCYYYHHKPFWHVAAYLLH